MQHTNETSSGSLFVNILLNSVRGVYLGDAFSWGSGGSRLQATVISTTEDIRIGGHIREPSIRIKEISVMGMGECADLESLLFQSNIKMLTNP